MYINNEQWCGAGHCFRMTQYFQAYHNWKKKKILPTTVPSEHVKMTKSYSLGTWEVCKCPDVGVLSLLRHARLNGYCQK